MRFRSASVLTLLIAAASAGCGALFNSGPGLVTFTSNPDRAEVWVDGTPRGRTPLMLQLSKNQNHTVLLKKEGFEDFGAVINRKVSAGFVVLDVLGGLVPIVIDAATGSWYTLSTSAVYGSLGAAVAAGGAEPRSGVLTADQLASVRAGEPAERVLRQEPAFSSRLIQQVRIAVENGNVRSGPGSSYDVVLRAPQGTVLVVEAERGDWYQVALNAEVGASSGTGYVHRSIVQAITAVAPAGPAVADATAPRATPTGTPPAVPPQPSPGQPAVAVAVAEPTRAAPAPGPAPGRPLTQRREGFWFNVGLGYGSLGCQDCDYRLDGLSGGLALGGTLSQKVLLGVATNGWSRSEDGVTLTAGTLTASIRFYPSATGWFFLLGGLGVGSVRIDAGGYSESSEAAAGAVLGVGYDFRVGSMVSITPFWNGVGLSSSDGDANFGQIGVGLTVH